MDDKLKISMSSNLVFLLLFGVVRVGLREKEEEKRDKGRVNYEGYPCYCYICIAIFKM